MLAWNRSTTSRTKGSCSIEATAFAATSIKEYITPQQLADQMVFIASPRGRTITGQAISGGMLLAPAAFLFIAGMFASGIVTALIIYRKNY